MTSRVRDRTPKEMLDGAPNVLQRLTQALDRFDAGNSIDIHTIAGLTRTVLGSGRGDRLVLRLSNAFNLKPPSVAIPAVAELRGPVTLRIGPIPCEPKDAAKSVPLMAWLDDTAIRLPSGSTMKWDRFIRDFANDASTHLSVHVNTELEEIKLHQGPAGSMVEYMVRAAGAVAEHALSTVLNQALGSPVLERKHYAGPIRVQSIVVSGNEEFGFDFFYDSPSGGHVATVPLASVIHEISLVWDPVAETASMKVDSRPLS